MDTELRKFVAPEFIFGEGARQMAARYAKNFGAGKVLIVTDPCIIAAGMGQRGCRGHRGKPLPASEFEDLIGARGI